MAYRFKRKESIAAGFARIAREQISVAVTALEKSPDDGVHDARRAIKRLRGLLRLFRKAMPGESFKRANGDLRKAARSLSAVRDAQVRLVVFEKVAKDAKDDGIAELRRSLTAAVKTAIGARSRHPPAAAAIATLDSVGTRLPSLEADAGWPVLCRGLKNAYRRARKAHAAAHAEVSTEALHAWRRRSKDFQYQTQLLRKIDPGAMKRRYRKVSKLNDSLGDDHDLAVLDKTLTAARGMPADLREKLCARIAKRRKKLQRRAFDLGSELFFEKPSKVIGELGRQWKDWQRG